MIIFNCEIGRKKLHRTMCKDNFLRNKFDEILLPFYPGADLGVGVGGGGGGRLLPSGIRPPADPKGPPFGTF